MSRNYSAVEAIYIYIYIYMVYMYIALNFYQLLLLFVVLRRKN